MTTINKTLSSFPGFLKGDYCEIWYMRLEFFRDGICGDFSKVDFDDLNKTHILLGTIDGLASLGGKHTSSNRLVEMLYSALQGENWNRDGEANEFIQSRGLGHGSMSVGDIIRFNHGPDAVSHYSTYICKPIGFQKV